MPFSLGVMHRDWMTLKVINTQCTILCAVSMLCLTQPFGSDPSNPSGIFFDASDPSKDNLQKLIGSGWRVEGALNWTLQEDMHVDASGEDLVLQSGIFGRFKAHRNPYPWFSWIIIPVACCAVLAYASHWLGPQQSMPRCTTIVIFHA